MLHFNLVTSLSSTNLVAGVAEQEEGGKNECSEEREDEFCSSFVGESVAPVFDATFQPPFRAVPHLII